MKVWKVYAANGCIEELEVSRVSGSYAFFGRDNRGRGIKTALRCQAWRIFTEEEPALDYAEVRLWNMQQRIDSLVKEHAKHFEYLSNRRRALARS